jgi:hypothetical protein
LIASRPYLDQHAEKCHHHTDEKTSKQEGVDSYSIGSWDKGLVGRFRATGITKFLVYDS